MEGRQKGVVVFRDDHRLVLNGQQRAIAFNAVCLNQDMRRLYNTLNM